MPDDRNVPTSPTPLGRLGRVPADQAAWGEFAERYGCRIYGWCRHLRLQQADAEAAERVGMKVATVYVARSQVQKMLQDEVRKLEGRDAGGREDGS
jgi:hypothetical protein